MEWAALITWVLTAGGGFVMLGLWLSGGGMKQPEEPGRRIRPPRILSHFGLAAAGLVIWIVYVITDSEALAWIAFVALVPVALLGFSMLAIWLAGRRPAPAGAPESAAAAEQRFPVPIVVLHGVLAVVTVVLVFLTAVGVGE
jgi:manganese efflux pump family protein